jgi:hypothetical protein
VPLEDGGASPPARSHARTVPSIDPDTAVRPSPVTDTLKIGPVCPRRAMRQSGGTHSRGRFSHSSQRLGSSAVPTLSWAARDTGLSAGSLYACWKNSSGNCPSTDAWPRAK